MARSPGRASPEQGHPCATRAAAFRASHVVVERARSALAHLAVCPPPTLPHLQDRKDSVGQGVGGGVGGGDRSGVGGAGGPWGLLGGRMGGLSSGGPGAEGGLLGGAGAERAPREQGVPSGMVHGTPCCALKGNPQGGPS